MELRGFILGVFCPSESGLFVSVDVSNIARERYIGFVEELEDFLGSIDERYAVYSERLRGRGLRGRFRVVRGGGRIRRVEFAPFPSSFLNVLRNVRRDLYNAINMHSIAVQAMPGFSRYLYVVPPEEAEALIHVARRLNERIEGLRQKIQAFVASEYRHVEDLLRRWGIDPPPPPPPPRDIELVFTPIVLGDAEIARLVTENPVLAEELKKYRERVVAGVLKAIAGEVEEIVRAFSGEKRHIAVERLKRIARIAEHLGFEEEAKTISSAAEALSRGADPRSVITATLARLI